MSLWIESGQPVPLSNRKERKETDRKRPSLPAIGKPIREKVHSQAEMKMERVVFHSEAKRGAPVG